MTLGARWFFRRPSWLALVLPLLSAACGGPAARDFVTTNARTVAIPHVRVIDGTGAPGKDDQTVVVRDGTIQASGSAAAVAVPSEASVIDGRGRTLIPGLVGMHEHLFYQIEPPGGGTKAVPAQEAFARLYLAAGVTTIRTAGTLDFNGDLRLKRDIESGRVAGPDVNVTGPYLYAQPGPPDPDRIAREVESQADRGATSFKAYTTLRPSELEAAIRAAHARGLRVTGHLCAVGYREAAAMGIDNVEHGLAVDTEFFSGRQPGVCPDQGASVDELARTDVLTDMAVQRTIADLINHGVAVTSTLAVFETVTGDQSALDPRMAAVLAPGLRDQYEATRARWTERHDALTRMWAAMLTREMQFERAFLKGGGLLLAGVDPTGWGGVVAGFGDQRELELLVEAGLTPEEAIRVASSNGAELLSAGGRIGTIAPGYQADLVLVRGNPSVSISDVRNVEMVFRKGIGYDPSALIASTQGTVGAFDLRRILHSPLHLLAIAIALHLIAKNVRRLIRRRRRVQPAVAST
jgi:imidazolonepropionase-like amidohydrolase